MAHNKWHKPSQKTTVYVLNTHFDLPVYKLMTYWYINSSQKIMLEGLSNNLRGQMTPKSTKVVHSSPDLPRPGQTIWDKRRR